MKTKYNAIIDTIICFEDAYTNEDISTILFLKDFITEAKILLRNNKYDIHDNEIIHEMAKVLELSLIQNLDEHGYPNFKDVNRSFSDLTNDDDIYIIHETINYSDSTTYNNRIYLTYVNELWKIAHIEQY